MARMVMLPVGMVEDNKMEVPNFVLLDNKADKLCMEVVDRSKNL